MPEHEAVYDEYIRNKKENKAEDTFKQVLKKFREEMTELEKAGVFEKSETAEILSDRKNTAEKKISRKVISRRSQLVWLPRKKS